MACDITSTLAHSRRLSIIVGGTQDEKIRREVKDGKRPRIDVLEMETAFKARVYDFSQFYEAAQQESRTSWTLRLSQRVNQWSLGLAYDTLRHVKDDDIVYATGEDVGFPLATMMRAQRVTRPGVIIRLEDPFRGRTLWQRMGYNIQRHYALQRADRIVCRNIAHLHYLHSIDKVPIDKLAVVRETVDQTFYSIEAAVSAPELGTISQTPYILSAGLEMRDYHTVIEAVRGLPVNLIIGAGSPWAHSSFQVKETEQLPPNVHVLSFSPIQMRSLFRHAAFIVVPVKPTLRTCGISVILEAWAMGKGVIATQTVSLRDYAVNGENALFVEPYNVDELRGQIIYMLEHGDVADHLGRNGRRIVETDLNLDRYVERIGQIVESVAAERASARKTESN